MRLIHNLHIYDSYHCKNIIKKLSKCADTKYNIITNLKQLNNATSPGKWPEESRILFNILVSYTNIMVIYFIMNIDQILCISIDYIFQKGLFSHFDSTSFSSRLKSYSIEVKNDDHV